MAEQTFRVVIDGVPHSVEWINGTGVSGLEQHCRQAILGQPGMAVLSLGGGRNLLVHWGRVTQVEVSELLDPEASDEETFDRFRRLHGRN